MRESVRGLRESLDAVKDIYKSAKYAGVGCGIKSTGIGNGTTEEGRVVDSRDLKVDARRDPERLHRDGPGPLHRDDAGGVRGDGPAGHHHERPWDKELGAICGETWASRATTLELRGGAEGRAPARRGSEDARRSTTSPAASTSGSVVYSFTTKPGTPEAEKDPTTHFTFSYATQVVILDDDGHLERVVAAHDVGRAINPRLCAEQMEGGVHMGLGYALSENFPTTGGRPDSLKLRDFGLVPAKHMPHVDIILIEVPDEVGGYGAKGVGEIGCVATASAVAAALHSYDGNSPLQAADGRCAGGGPAAEVWRETA